MSTDSTKQDDFSAEVSIGKLINTIKSNDVKLRSIIEINPGALEIARSLDLNTTWDAQLGPLHGVGVLLKDNIDTADKMLTCAGSPSLAKAPAPADAPLVEKLRSAGAVILGKTNLSEFANIRSTNSSSGWSSRGGLTRNPHDLLRSASGSSSGSAAAVAAGFAPIAIGTETNGSIISPATCCGVVGFKPSRKRISQLGIVPISSTYDTAGPITRSVKNAALATSIMSDTDLHSSLSAESLSGARVGLLLGSVEAHSDLTDILMAASDTFRGLGATVIDIDESLDLGAGWAHTLRVMLTELVWEMGNYLDARGDTVDVHSLGEIIEFNRQNAQTTMPHFGQDLFFKAMKMAGEPRSLYEEALEKAHDISTTLGLDKMFDKHELDSLVGISGGPAGMIDLLNGEAGRHVSLAPLPAVAGYPHLTVPGGSIGEMPIGISFIGRHNADAQVLSHGYAFEQATKAILKPEMKNQGLVKA